MASQPTIPPWLDWLRIEDLKVGDSKWDSSISLLPRRADDGDVVTGILERKGFVVVEFKR